MDGCVDANLWVGAYVSDGTDTERKCARLFADECSGVEYEIPHPKYNNRPLVFNIYNYRGYPFIILQDSKHALKTARNNLFSGAKFLVIGNCTLTYADVLAIAEHPESPLYWRDVEKVDRQDDMAAARLFSSATLRHLEKHHPEKTALIVYLFVLGELVDAYQSRTMTPSTRVQIALRTLFFLDSWTNFLAKAGYGAEHYVSRQANDIFRILCRGIIAAVVMIRQHRPKGREKLLIAFLAWLWSTEINEHIFGIARKINKNFTIYDFVFMVTKINTMLGRSPPGDPRVRAGGYFHTWQYSEGVKMGEALLMPDEATMKKLAKLAWDENESLCIMLGFSSDEVLGRLPHHGLPNFSTFAKFTTAPDPASTALPIVPKLVLDESETESESDWDEDAHETPREHLFRVLAEFQQTRSIIGQTDRKIDDVSYAVALAQLTDINAM